MRDIILAANWKMNHTIAETKFFFDRFFADFQGVHDRKVVFCPSFTSLVQAKKHLVDRKNIFLGAQNFYWEESGAFTGEISVGMLKELGVNFVIIGHSERRHIFGETDIAISKKIETALRFDLTPIFCVGEKLEEREAGITEEVLTQQLEGGMDGLTEEMASQLVIAYEPVWAIGTGKTATPVQANDAHKFIREYIANKFSYQLWGRITILYGGSVNPENVADLMAEKEIDGALVGGASLDHDQFKKIVFYDR